MFFPAFARILVFVAAFFFFGVNQNIIDNLIFPACGGILVLVAVFFYKENHIKKSIENTFFPSLWQDLDKWLVQLIVSLG